MANFYTSANMNLPVPVVGVDPGPDFANNINASLTLIDAHDHSSGSGVQITPAGLNISSDLAINGNNLTLIRSARFSPQASPLSLGTDLSCAYVSGVDLYFNDGSGNQVRITQSGGVAGSPGSIAGLTSPASATYVSANSTFVWQSAANTPANLDAASVILRNLVANSHGLTLSPPASMGANYTITLPSLPGSTSFMTIDASGNEGASIAVSGGITSSNIAAGGIATSNLAAQAVTAAKIANNTITAAQIANATITGTQLVSNINLPGSLVTENTAPLVVSGATPSSTSLAILRSSFNSAGVVQSGEGIIPGIHALTGTYVMTFGSSPGFSETPIVVATAISTSPTGTPFFTSVKITSSTSCTVYIFNSSGTLIDAGFSVIAIGQRN